jgi:hypothetical protein
MPAVRSKQIALAAAVLGVTGEQCIQGFITAGLLSLAANDRIFAQALARTAGVSWEELESAEDHATVLAKVLP